MKKSIVAALALASAATFSGASVAAPATAPNAQAKAAHTLRWKLNETASHNVGNHFVGSDTIRSRRTGEIIGYDSTTGSFFPKTSMVRLQVAASVKGGILVGRLSADFSTVADVVVFEGPILKGTGKFKGAEGTITARSSNGGNKTFVTIRYR